MKYYYLIATLPDLSLQMETATINFDEIIETIDRNLSNKDQQAFKYLVYSNDNRNLLNAIFKKHHGFTPLPFQRPATFGPAMIQDYVQERYNFPEYMSDFLITFQERFSEMPMDEIEIRLMEGFYQEVAEKADAFIADFYLFEKVLNSMVAAFNRSNYNFYESRGVLEDQEITDKLTNEGSGLSALANAYPFITNLRDAIHSKDPLSIEETLDKIRWEYIDSYRKDFFSSQHVFGYSFQLFMLQRQAAVGQADAKEHFERLSEQVGAFRELI